MPYLKLYTLWDLWKRQLCMSLYLSYFFALDRSVSGISAALWLSTRNTCFLFILMKPYYVQIVNCRSIKLNASLYHRLYGWLSHLLHIVKCCMHLKVTYTLLVDIFLFYPVLVSRQFYCYVAGMNHTTRVYSCVVHTRQGPIRINMWRVVIVHLPTSSPRQSWLAVRRRHSGDRRSSHHKGTAGLQSRGESWANVDDSGASGQTNHHRGRAHRRRPVVASTNQPALCRPPLIENL